MARSTYIYLVTDNYNFPLASFTVKHELISWIRKNYCDKRVIYKDLFDLPIIVLRMKDNPKEIAEFVKLDINELLEQEK